MADASVTSWTVQSLTPLPPLSGERETVEHYSYDETDEGLIGQGSFGGVFRGVDNDTDQAVAIKKISRQEVNPEEIETVRRLQCPFIIHYRAVITKLEQTYLVMDLCDMDLAHMLRSHGRLSDCNLETLARHVAQGYLAIHEQSIVHRDLKPQNILLEVKKVDGNDDRIVRAKISDFGCSRISDELSNLAGTPCYMAPEVGANLLDRHTYSEAADMWSMGVVFFESATARLPFEEQDLCRLFLRAASDNDAGFEAPTADGAPEWLRALIERLLVVNPTKRLKARALHNHLIFGHPLAESTSAADLSRVGSNSSIGSRGHRHHTPLLLRCISGSGDD